MDALGSEQVGAAIVLVAALIGIGLVLVREPTAQAERVTVGGLLGSVVERHPSLRSAWARASPARSWLAAHLPPGVADLGLVVALIVLLGATVVAGALLDEVAEEPKLWVDLALADVLGGWRPPALVRVAEWVSELMSPGSRGLVAAGVVAQLVWVRRRVEALGLFASVAGNTALTAVLKELLDRDRPAGVDGYHPLGDSFPSGHTSGTAALAVFLAWLLTRRRGPTARGTALGAALVLVVAVAASRVYLEVHWLSDVVAGAAVGTGWAALCIAWTRIVLARQNERVAAGAAETD